MPVTAEELPDSRQWTTGANLSVEFSYQVRGTASDVEAKNTTIKSQTLRSLGGEGAIVRKPVAVYVGKVYEEGDFSGLGIGS